MSKNDETLYVTTAIPFVNARPHLGFALELCIADAIARHARGRGTAVRFVSGTDDHSLKNVLAAERAGTPTAQFVSENARAFQQLSAALQISLDQFVQTSEHPAHRDAVHALWRACLARGDLYRQKYRGLYCVGCERFAEPDEQRCAEHDADLEWVEEDNWFFRLSRYTDLLREQIEQDKFAIIHAGAREEALSLLREPLRDLCVSRSAERARGWGIPVPDDAGQVIWVWFDALTYYLSALNYPAAQSGSDLARFWTGGGRRVQVIGKGIARFHALFWPAFLSSAGLPLPDELLVHGYLTLDGAKISKSGRALDPLPLIEDYGSDALRYYLLRHIRTGRDGDFSLERLEQAYNAELANALGNLANRLLGLLQRATTGQVPPPTENTSLTTLAAELRERVDQAVQARQLDTALDTIFELIHATNRNIDQTAPWTLIKRGGLREAQQILRPQLEALRTIAIELDPFLPGAAAALKQALQLNTNGDLTTGSTLSANLTLFPRRQPTQGEEPRPPTIEQTTSRAN